MELRGMFQALSPVKRGVKKAFTSVLELAQVKLRRHISQAFVRSRSHLLLKTGAKKQELKTTLRLTNYEKL